MKMKKRFGLLMFFAGLAVILYSICGFFVESRLIASNCNLRCGSNNRACYDALIPAKCSCNLSTHSAGKSYSNSPTYGSESGSNAVRYKSVICSSTIVCEEDKYVDDTMCKLAFGYEFPLIFDCYSKTGSKCMKYKEVVADSSHYMNCEITECAE